jgi:hypothetical protein
LENKTLPNEINSNASNAEDHQNNRNHWTVWSLKKCLWKTDETS